MANTVEIILKATDNASGSMNKLNASFKSLTGFSLGAAGGIALAGKAMQEVIQYTKQAIENNDKYVTSIVDMARFTGDQVDQMSRLVQVADDAFLSQEALNNAMSIGAKKGLDMSVAGIKALADEYNALATPQERAKLLNDNFGRSGLAMGKLLEQGSAGITKNMEAIADSLVVTDAIVKSTFEYKRSIDAVKDAQDALNYSVAQGTMPALTKLNVRWADFLEVIDESETITKLITAAFWMLEGAIQGLDIMVGGYTTKEEYAVKVMEEYNRIAIEHRSIMEDVGSSTASAEEQLAIMNQTSKDMLAITDGMQSANENYETSLKNIAETEYKTDDERIAAIKEVEAAHELATRKIILGYTEQLLAADGLTQQEVEFLLAKGVEWGIYSQKAVDEMQRAIDQASRLKNAINGIPSWKNITITTVYAGQSNGGQSSGPVTTGSGNVIGGAQGTGVQEKMATGGSFTVPGWAGYEGFNMGGVATASAGEKITVQRPGGDDKLIKAVRQMAYDPYENARVLTDYLVKTGR